MSFKHACFIQGCSHDLYRISEELEKIGYKRGLEDYFDDYSDCSPIYLIAKTDGTYHYAGTLSLYGHDWGRACQTNERLFLAIAAMRNDSDKHQWFICKEEFISTHTLDIVKKDTWQKSIHDKLSYSQKRLWKKATVKELINHFKY